MKKEILYINSVGLVVFPISLSTLIKKVIKNRKKGDQEPQKATKNIYLNGSKW